jgi:hypothetical protein
MRSSEFAELITISTLVDEAYVSLYAIISFHLVLWDKETISGIGNLWAIYR